MAFARKPIVDCPSTAREDDASRFPRRHFRIEGDRAYCLTGSSLRDLFEYEKRTVLKARGLFGADAGAPAAR